jgi:hypothetical protein
MYFIAFFGALMAILSVVMIINPGYWARGIVTFSQAAWFHPFEILSRLVFGVLFINFADQTRYPTLILIIGYVLVAVAVGLSLTPPSKHRRFALWSAKKFEPFFRPSGVASLAFGVFLVYVALGGAGMP